MYVTSRIGGHDSGLVDVDAVENGNRKRRRAAFEIPDDESVTLQFPKSSISLVEADHHFACKRGLPKRPF